MWDFYFELSEAELNKAYIFNVAEDNVGHWIKIVKIAG